jgi:hypothetical protein
MEGGQLTPLMRRVWAAKQLQPVDLPSNRLHSSFSSKRSAAGTGKSGVEGMCEK